MADWTDEQREEVARVLEAYAADVASGQDDPRSLDAALDAIWSTVSQQVPVRRDWGRIIPLGWIVTAIMGLVALALTLLGSR